MQLTQRVPMANMDIVYTVEPDPKNLLGDSGGYLSKPSFTASEITTAPGTASFNKNVSPSSVDLGGIVKVFPVTQGAQERMTFIDQWPNGCRR
ncbi:MAG TPA: hypothetical protein VF003_06700 [Pseudonocardiaceae bacterium]